MVIKVPYEVIPFERFEGFNVYNPNAPHVIPLTEGVWSMSLEDYRLKLTHRRRIKK